MKKLVEQMVAVCDSCGAQTWGSHCEQCGKDLCYDCSTTGMVTYHHSTWAGGHGDGTYCLKCEAELREKPTARFAALWDIEKLRTEETAWYADFKRRAEAAERAVERTMPKEKL